MKKKLSQAKVNPILLFLAVVLAVVQVIIYNQESTTGQDLTSLQKTIAEHEKENSRVTKQIASNSAISTLLKKAQNLALSDNIEMISLDVPLPVALNPDL